MSAVPDAFESAYQWIRDAEGGYSDRASDHGGATMHGVTQTVYNDYRRKRALLPQPVRNISEAEEQDIYRSLYWIPAGCDKLQPLVGLAHFDAAVNHGVHRACLILQDALGVPQDGIVGPHTVCRALAIGEYNVMSVYLKLREAFYRYLANKDRSQMVFLDGWLNRIARLRKRVGVKD